MPDVFEIKHLGNSKGTNCKKSCHIEIPSLY